MKLRYIDLGRINPKYDAALWEFPRIYDLKGESTVFVYRYDRPYIELASTNADPKKDILLQNLPSNVEIHRCYQTTLYSGLFYHNMENIGITFVIPRAILSHNNESLNLRKIRPLDLVGILREEGIKVVQIGNDLKVVCDDGIIRKFGGRLYRGWGNEYMTYQVGVSFTIDYDLISNTVNYDEGKIKARNITDIRDYVIGLWDINPDLDADEIIREYIYRYAKRLGLEVEMGSITKPEWNAIEHLANKLYTDEWVYNLVHPDFGDVSDELPLFAE